MEYERHWRLSKKAKSDFHDLKREPRGYLDKPYHSLFFHLPRVALDAIADEAQGTANS
jgi:AraC family transcriptional regulator